MKDQEQTTFIIEDVVSDAAKETVEEKLRRLMLADAESLIKSQTFLKDKT